MAYDLVISEHGDLIVAGNRDLAGVSGIDLINQRIMIRLIVHRGAWFYDPDAEFGSELWQVLGRGPDASFEIDARVREALGDMNDIAVSEVAGTFLDDENSILVNVTYSIVSDQTDETSGEPTGDLAISATVVVPVVAGGGEAG